MKWDRDEVGRLLTADSAEEVECTWPTRRKGAISGVARLWWAVLLVMPAWALSRMACWVDWRILLGAPVAVSLVAFFMCRTDKRRAEAGEWRIPESGLHMSELLGGWPGAFLAQRMFRHKIAKTSYQVMFWGIVALHELVATDAVLGWRIAKGVMEFVKARMG